MRTSSSCMSLVQLVSWLVFVSIFIIGAPAVASTLKQPADNVSQIADSQVLHTPFPYYFPNSSNAETMALFPMPDCHGVRLEEATIDQLQAAMIHGRLKSVQLVRCYRQRIAQTNEYLQYAYPLPLPTSPLLQWSGWVFETGILTFVRSAVLELNPDAEQIAAKLDAERATGRSRGPLHGIPFLVKDNIASKDQMETTAGSWALLGSVVPRDSFVVHRLREAGAVLLGKAALSEWADMRSSLYSEGYSPRGGQSRSPYNLTVNPGGSSSGSAIAVAANMCSFSLGTETDGSGERLLSEIELGYLRILY